MNFLSVNRDVVVVNFINIQVGLGVKIIFLREKLAAKPPVSPLKLTYTSKLTLKENKKCVLRRCFKKVIQS